YPTVPGAQHLCEAESGLPLEIGIGRKHRDRPIGYSFANDVTERCIEVPERSRIADTGTVWGIGDDPPGGRAGRGLEGGDRLNSEGDVTLHAGAGGVRQSRVDGTRVAVEPEDRHRRRATDPRAGLTDQRIPEILPEFGPPLEGIT